jgi:hypothetical protein
MPKWYWEVVLLIWQSMLADFDDMVSRPTCQLGSRHSERHSQLVPAPHDTVLASALHSRWLPPSRRGLRMATGRVQIRWSLRAPKTETRNQNPNPNWKPIRVEIHHQNQTRRYPKPERIPETRMDTRNPWINIHIFICINKRQQIINIFMSQFWIDLII